MMDRAGGEGAGVPGDSGGGWGGRRDHDRGVADVTALTPADGPLPLLADCEPDCPALTECADCTRPLCGEHSIDYYVCTGAGEWHEVCHYECCGPCQDEAARETNDERTRDVERWPT